MKLKELFLNKSYILGRILSYVYRDEKSKVAPYPVDANLH